MPTGLKNDSLSLPRSLASDVSKESFMLFMHWQGLQSRWSGGCV